MHCHRNANLHELKRQRCTQFINISYCTWRKGSVLLFFRAFNGQKEINLYELRADFISNFEKMRHATHVVQQRSMPGDGGGMSVGAADTAEEHEADSVAEVAAQRSTQRQAEEDQQ